MKRLLICLLILCLALSVCACGASPAETAPTQTAKAQTEPVKTEPAKTEPAKTEPVESSPVETEPTMPLPVGARIRDDDELLAPFLGLWSWGAPDGYWYICADWTWVRMDANAEEVGNGLCAYLENFGLVLEREDGADEDYLWFGSDGRLYNVASEPLSRAEFPKPQEDLSCYPYEEPDLSRYSELALEIADELYPKVVALEDFFYDAATYGYDYMDQMLCAFGIIWDLYPETRNYFILEEVFDGDDFVGLESRYTCRYDPDGSEDKDEIRADIAAFEEAADRILAGLTDDMTARDKYCYLAKVISENADYDYERESGAENAPWAGIMGGKFVCEGYSVAMQYLCRRADLYCKVVEGNSRGESHSWNLVKLPTGTYYVDVTWADGSGEPGDMGWYRYIMLTQDDILFDHEISDGTVATGT